MVERGSADRPVWRGRRPGVPSRLAARATAGRRHSWRSWQAWSPAAWARATASRPDRHASSDHAGERRPPADRARALRNERTGPAVDAGPVAAPSLESVGAPMAPVAVPVPVNARPPTNGSILPTTRVPGAAAAEAKEGAAATQSYTNPWRYCPGDIQLGVSDGLGCDEWWLAASYIDSGTTHYGMDAVGAWQNHDGPGRDDRPALQRRRHQRPRLRRQPGAGWLQLRGRQHRHERHVRDGHGSHRHHGRRGRQRRFRRRRSRSKVLEVKVLGPYGTLTDSAASQGITYAVGHGASVIAFPLYEIGPAPATCPDRRPR